MGFGMKKLFDKYIAQSSRGQICALVVAFVVLIVTGAIIGQFVLEKDNPYSAKFGYRWTWGLMQCVDGGFVDATLTSNTKLTPDDKKISKPAPIAVIVLSLGFWLGGMIIISFFTGAATNFLEVRREKIHKGSVDYSFENNYILIIGYDFQTRNLLKQLFKEFKESGKSTSIVLLTDLSVENIYDTLCSELQHSDLCRLFIMRKSIATKDSYKKLRVTGAEEIYIIGDENVVGRDGKALQAFKAVSSVAEDEISSAAKHEMEPKPPTAQDRQIKIYLHIEDSVLYTNIRAIDLLKDELKTFDLEVFNYYESWAWECWSNMNSKDVKDPYLPIRHLKDTERAELFVIGTGHMGRVMANFAMPLMNYGASGKHGKITMFDLDGSKKSFLPDKKTLDTLPELEVVFLQMDGCSDEANAIMLEAARRKDTSVTVVIAISEPDAAIRAYAELSNSLCRENISVLLWQATESTCVPDKSYLRMGGRDSEADKRKLRYFGMTDRLPWKNSPRFNYGMAVNYFYQCWCPGGTVLPDSPDVNAADFVEKAKSMWNSTAPGESEHKAEHKVVKAMTEWVNLPRWSKWASVNCGDSFREKLTLFEGVPYTEAAGRILKAEHNRWWTEKILGGWLPSGKKPTEPTTHADKENMMHGDMRPFEELQQKDKDKISIAAMAAVGFF